MQPGEDVEIEARDEHGGVIGVLLVADQKFGGGSPRERKVVVAGPDRLEERGSGHKHGAILNVGVVLLRSMRTTVPCSIRGRSRLTGLFVTR